MSANNSPIDLDLLKILACPKCKNELRLAQDESGLICEICRLKYPIEESIPIMLIDKAVPLNQEAS